MPDNLHEDAKAADPTEPTAPEPAGRGVLRRLVLLLIALGILAGGGAIAFHWMTNRPKARRRPPEARAVLVETRRVRRQREQIVLRAMGTVVPARSLELAPRVGGGIVWISPKFLPGGRFDADEPAVRIDPEDYKLAVRLQESQVRKMEAEVEQAAAAIGQREADIARNESSLALEMGQQSVAAREYELLGAEVAAEDEALVLRKPQLKQARAALSAAESALSAAKASHQAVRAALAAARVALEQARLAEARTEVRAPFDAAVRSRHVDVGAQVAAGAPLASLVGTEEYWVRVSVPVDELRRIRVPGFNSDEGSPARVYHPEAWGPDIHREGVVMRLMSDVEPQGRMARLLVAVKDPLHLKRPLEDRRPLILGTYVRVMIEGETLEDIIRIDRTSLHDGSRVWVMGQDDRLDVRKVRIAWAGRDHVCVKEGLAEGERLVVSGLAAPVAGMKLRVEEADGAASKPAADSRPAPSSREGRP